MKKETKALVAQFVSRDQAWFDSNRIIATQQDIKTFEDEFCRIHLDYISYLTECGYEILGSEYFLRIDELKDSVTKLNNERKPDPNGKIIDCFVFLWDGSGNPVGISWTDNKVYVDDHDFGLGIKLADSFDEYVQSLISNFAN